MQLVINTIDKRSWVEVDLEQLRRNMEALEALCPSSTKPIAVVKADAYGHGDSVVGAYLEKNCGIHHFAVSNIDEAMALRSSGVQGHILILGYTAPEHAQTLFENNISQTIVSEEYAAIMQQQPFDVHYQVAIDTGMNRIGLSADNIDECVLKVRSLASKMHIEGIFTHFSVADSHRADDISFTLGQISKFRKIADAVSDLKLDYVHCCNSAASLAYISQIPSSLLGYVRLGIVLYGLSPDKNFKIPKALKPALSWKSVISMVKTLRKGESVGYGRAFTADRDMKIATIPTGYADGYPRRLSGQGYVIIDGRRAPICGKVCMDQMMVDVSDIPSARMGGEVVILGESTYTDFKEEKVFRESLSADDLAALADTISYEIICGISKRVQRFYVY